jgi:hypothetical protein
MQSYTSCGSRFHTETWTLLACLTIDKAFEERYDDRAEVGFVREGE